MNPIVIDYNEIKARAADVRIIADALATNGKRKRIVQRPLLGKFQLTVGDEIIAITSNLQTAVDAFNNL